jgi:hypothetical protein
LELLIKEFTVVVFSIPSFLILLFPFNPVPISCCPSHWFLPYSITTPLHMSLFLLAFELDSSLYFYSYYPFISVTTVFSYSSMPSFHFFYHCLYSSRSTIPFLAFPTTTLPQIFILLSPRFITTVPLLLSVFFLSMIHLLTFTIIVPLLLFIFFLSLNCIPYLSTTVPLLLSLRNSSFPYILFLSYSTTVTLPFCISSVSIPPVSPFHSVPILLYYWLFTHLCIPPVSPFHFFTTILYTVPLLFPVILITLHLIPLLSVLSHYSFLYCSFLFIPLLYFYSVLPFYSFLYSQRLFIPFLY